MLSLLPLALALVVHVEAGRYNNGLKFERRGLLNETASAFTNTSSSISTSSSTTSSSSRLSTILTTSLPQSTSSFSLGPTLSSNGTTPAPTCVGLVTYYGSIPPTVYSTVTEGFDVTVTASNASVTAAETLITPPPACTATVVPLQGTFQPLATIEVSSAITIEESQISSDWSSTDPATTAKASVTGGINPHHPQVESTDNINGPPKPTPPPPAPPPPPPGPQNSAGGPSVSHTIVKSTIYASAPYTSTVIVTKKTPVVVVSPQTSSPPVFQNPSPPPNNPPPPPPPPPPPSSKNPGQAIPPPAAPTPNNNPPPASNRPGNAPAATQGPAIVPGPAATNTGIGNVIVSLIETQNYEPAATALPQTTVANVPIIVLPSTVLIGTSAIPIPQSSQVLATVAGQTFTVRPSEIAGPNSQTVALSNPNVQAQPASTTRVSIASGITAIVGDSTAVIQGTTYRIGFGATPTYITISGHPIGLGPYGLELPSTTVAAGAITAAPLIVESAGGLTFSIGPSLVVVEGTTYRIGPGASQLTTEIDGQTVSIGPGGVGLKTTTLKPTAAETGDRTVGAPGSAATGEVGEQGNGAGVMRSMGMKEMLGWTVMAAMLGGLLL